MVELRIISEDDVIERRRPFDAPVLAAQDLDALVREQLSEGFVEQSAPEWVQRLNELIGYWDVDDPGFDAEVLRAQLLEAGEPLAKETMEKLAWWEKGQPRDPANARAWLTANADAILPGVMLALRYPDAQVLAHVDSLLGELARPEVLEAAMSVVEHPTPSELHAERPSHMPFATLKGLGKPDDELGVRLANALDHDDSRVREVAAAVLAEFSKDDVLFAQLWRHRVAARESDGMCWAMIRAAEVRRAPELRDFLLWMQKSARFRAPALVERIGDALAHLKNR